MFLDIMLNGWVLMGLPIIAAVFFGIRWALKKISNQNVQGILVRLNDAAERAVKSVHEAYVKPLKDKQNFTDEDKAAAKKMAIEEMKSYLGQKGISEISTILGFNEKKMGDKIEEAVSNMKK